MGLNLLHEQCRTLRKTGLTPPKPVVRGGSPWRTLQYLTTPSSWLNVDPPINRLKMAQRLCEIAVRRAVW